jgi:hypothetical protein
VSAKNRQNQEGEKIKYLITDREGQFVIEVPAWWKVTFSAVNPNDRAPSGHYAVRVWEGEKLRAVFDSVKNMRDLSIPLARRMVQETTAAQWSRDSMGNFEETRKGQIDSSFPLEEADDPFGDDE